jgi:hypothetical protein
MFRILAHPLAAPVARTCAFYDRDGANAGYAVLGNVISTAAGYSQVTGTGADTLASLINATVGYTKVTGTGTDTLADVTSTGSGTLHILVIGTGADTLGSVTSTASGVI